MLTKMGKIMNEFLNTIMVGDVREQLKRLPDNSIDCVVTSPPYWGLRDYGNEGQIGLEESPEEFVANLVEVFNEVKRVLADDGTLWLNLGDSYASDTKGSGGKTAKQITNAGSFHTSKKLNHGLKSKDLVGIPWRVAFALQADGWYLRQDIIWAKPNPMPESVKDRCTRSHEYIFLLTKQPRYYYDHEAIKEPLANPKRTNFRPGKRAYAEGNTEQIPGERTRRNDGFEKYANGATFTNKNKRSVWHVATKPFKGAHFAVYPPKLIEPCILAGCPEGGVVLDPFFGSGTTGVVAKEHNRNYVGIELNPEYAKLAQDRLGI